MDRVTFNDLMVVVPGIMGTELRHGNDIVWGTSPGPVFRAVRTGLRSVAGLRLPADIGDAGPADGVTPGHLVGELQIVPGLWSPVHGYNKLLTWLARNFTLQPPSAWAPGNLIAFGYDWRLSIAYNSAQLGVAVEEGLGRWQQSHPDRRDAKVVYLCHSMGGLVARHYIECGGGHQTAGRVITLGTPYRGAVKALAMLVNGAPAGLGKRGEAVTAFIRSLPSVHQLAPGYESVVVDRALQNHRGVNLPGVDPYLMRAADEVHGQIRAAVDKRACVTRYRPVAGHLQPTATTAVFDGERLIFVNTIHDVDNGGDGTVPLFSAHPAEWDGDDDMQDLIRRDSGQHGGLQDLKGVRGQISGWLGRRVSYRGPEGEYGIGVEAPDFVLAGEPLAVAATVPEEVGRPRLIARVRNVDGRRAVEKQLVYGGEPRCRAEFPGLAAGVYEVRVGPLELPSGLAATPGRPVVKHVVVWAEGDEA